MHSSTCVESRVGEDVFNGPIWSPVQTRVLAQSECEASSNILQSQQQKRGIQMVQAVVQYTTCGPTLAVRLRLAGLQTRSGSHLER